MIDIKQFVKPGEQLNYTKQLKERGMWPPRLHKPNDNGNIQEKITTPFIVIPATPGDKGLRPLPNSNAFHSKGIWLEEIDGSPVQAPELGGKYVIKCRIRNNGDKPTYGGLVDFFVNEPANFLAAAAGSPIFLPALGHYGFPTIRQGDETIISCPVLWEPASVAELKYAIVVHAFDPFTDNIVRRFDATTDRHVGRHDNTADLYVRDWTVSAAIHDNGTEPSVNSVFYQTSDVWNRRSDTPGTFINDAPQHQEPQAGNGAAGDNFMFARISRNEALTEQQVNAHFLFAEFGTGSPYINCTLAPDPSVTFSQGEFSKMVSIPWHLHPSSSPHLCMAVQIYSEEDPHLSPGLLGYTPGWPTTDMMIINDNNKAQRNTGIWNGVTGTAGMHFSIIYNAATFTRDVELQLSGSQQLMEKLKNPRILIPSTRITQEFKRGTTFTLNSMQPGERRWIGLSFDSFSTDRDETISVYFNELVGKNIVNGFALEIKSASESDVLKGIFSFQSAILYRIAIGLGSSSAKEGLQRIDLSLKPGNDLNNHNVDNYLKSLPFTTQVITAGINEISETFKGVKDVFGISEATQKLMGLIHTKNVGAIMAQHNILLQQVDALLTMTLKSGGDVADILFTVRLQRDIYKIEELRSCRRFEELLKESESFISNYSQKSASSEAYISFVRLLLPSFESTHAFFNSRILSKYVVDIAVSFGRTAEVLQKAHLNFLNALLILLKN